MARLILRKGRKIWDSRVGGKNFCWLKSDSLLTYMKCDNIYEVWYLSSQVSRLVTDMVLTWNIFFKTWYILHVQNISCWTDKVKSFCDVSLTRAVMLGKVLVETILILVYGLRIRLDISDLIYHLYSYFLVFAFTEFSLLSFTSEVNKNKAACIFRRYNIFLFALSGPQVSWFCLLFPLV